MNEFEHYSEKIVYVDNDSMNLGNEILLTVYQRQYKFSVQLCSQLWHMITYQALEIFGQV